MDENLAVGVFGVARNHPRRFMPRQNGDGQRFGIIEKLADQIIVLIAKVIDDDRHAAGDCGDRFALHQDNTAGPVAVHLHGILHPVPAAVLDSPYDSAVDIIELLHQFELQPVNVEVMRNGDRIVLPAPAHRRGGETEGGESLAQGLPHLFHLFLRSPVARIGRRFGGWAGFLFGRPGSRCFLAAGRLVPGLFGNDLHPVGRNLQQNVAVDGQHQSGQGRQGPLQTLDLFFFHAIGGLPD